MGENPWWHPSEDDLDWNEPLPDVIELTPDYCAELPLWGGGFSWNIAWQYTKFSARLLDRLAAWQQEFDANFHWDTGWRSAEIRNHWASQAQELAADVRAELGTRAELTMRLWPLQDNVPTRWCQMEVSAGVGSPYLAAGDLGPPAESGAILVSGTRRLRGGLGAGEGIRIRPARQGEHSSRSGLVGPHLRLSGGVAASLLLRRPGADLRSNSTSVGRDYREPA